MVKDKWYAFSMDDGLVGISSRKSDLVRHYAGFDGSCKRIDKGQYEVSNICGYDERTFYIYKGLELALKNGWEESIKEFENYNDSEKECVIIL